MPRKNRALDAYISGARKMSVSAAQKQAMLRRIGAPETDPEPDAPDAPAPSKAWLRFERWGSLAAMLLLVIGIGMGVSWGIRAGQTPPPAYTEFTLPPALEAYLSDIDPVAVPFTSYEQAYRSYGRWVGNLDDCMLSMKSYMDNGINNAGNLRHYHSVSVTLAQVMKSLSMLSESALPNDMRSLHIEYSKAEGLLRVMLRNGSGTEISVSAQCCLTPVLSDTELLRTTVEPSSCPIPVTAQYVNGCIAQDALTGRPCIRIPAYGFMEIQLSIPDDLDMYQDTFALHFYTPSGRQERYQKAFSLEPPEDSTKEITRPEALRILTEIAQMKAEEE